MTDFKKFVNMIYLNRLYHFEIFKACLSQVLVVSFLNTFLKYTSRTSVVSGKGAINENVMMN